MAESSVENITDQIFAEASEAYNDNSNTAERNELSEQQQIISLMDESDGTRSNEPSTSSSGASSLRHRPTPSSNEMNEEDRISIKLKYINDEVQTVYINLNERVGNFKR